MAAKILYSLADDNPDLQKQIGCMTGVFQLFDRHQIVAGRRFSDQSPKRLPPGSPQFYNGTPERESSNSYQRPYLMEKYSNKIMQDKNRASTESSRYSFSSMSRSSSSSSLDCSINKTNHQEPDQPVFPETPAREFSTRQSHQTVDLRDVVKDSMYRHKFIVKDGPNQVVDYRESLDTLAKSQESNWFYNEHIELYRSKSYHVRDGPSFSIPKDCPRLSYDGRETNRGLIQSRPPSVVAKLMGLEALPNSSLPGRKESSKSVKATPRESTSLLWRDSDMKPIPRFPTEPAPWKQHAIKSRTKIHSPYSSVDCEVDKRLRHLAFTQSGKDLRALKQILEAMQSTETRQNTRGSNNLRAYDSPIVIMKPAKLVERLGMPVKDFRNNINKSTRRVNTVNAIEVRTGGRHTPGLTKQHLSKENATTSGKSLGSFGPRLPQLERRSRPALDSSQLRKQSAKQVSESSSVGARRSKYSNIQQNDGQHRGIKGESNKLSCRQTQGSNEVVNIPEYSEETDNMRSPISIPEKSTLPVRDHELPGLEYPSPVSVLDVGIYTVDSPSPVKHMLQTLKDDANKGINDQWQETDDVMPDTPSSPITSDINRKKLQDIEHLVQKLTRLNSGDNEAHTNHTAPLCENTKPDDMYISEILLASGLLLRDLGSNLTTFQFHSSGHPINPELFLVLEQTKFSRFTKQESKRGKFHRKLIFDAVNEILARKLALSVPFQRLVNKSLNAQKLLRDLCLEIEQLQVNKKKEDISLDEEEDDGLKSVSWEEVLNRAESWTDYDGEIPGITLEVERLIFKDLVNEVVLGEAADGRRVKPGRRCRQLFPK